MILLLSCNLQCQMLHNNPAQDIEDNFFGTLDPGLTVSLCCEMDEPQSVI